MLDFRSDTVTKPTPEMWEAMASAEIGDDVYREDPTVNNLQIVAAELLGKEAGLFVPSGTMGNLAAMLAHCNRGDEVILGNLAHTFLYEAGGLAALGGIHPHTILNQPDGTLDLGEVENSIRYDDAHFPVTRLVTIENTHNRCGGASLSSAYMQKLGKLANNHNLKLHVDGARIFNAAIDQGVPARELVGEADSVTFCLSKGLAAPVGSVLCGSREFIQKAHRARKQLGGGMRQAGILAAAGIVALEKMTGRLGEDHRRAKDLSKGLADIPGIVIDTDSQHTNMVYFDLGTEVSLNMPDFIDGLKVRGLLVGGAGRNRCRMVTHVWVDDDKIMTALEIIREVIAGDKS